MKIQFEIEITYEDSQMEANRLLKAKDMASALNEIANNLRKKAEWECESLEADSDPEDGVYVFSRLVHETLNKYGIIIDDLIQ